MPYPQTLQVFQQLESGDRVEIDHEIKIGFQSWRQQTRGIVVGKERRRHSLHFQRNYDDKVFSDVIVLRRDDGELTTVTLDEFSDLRVLEKAKP